MMGEPPNRKPKPRLATARAKRTAASAGPALVVAEGMAGQFLGARLSAADARLGETVPRLLGTGDSEAVHDFRVALRRMRTLLEVGRPVLGRFHADEVKAALRDVHRAAGALRDEEVIIEVVTSLEVGHPDVDAWIEGRRRRERRLRGALRRRIREGDLDRARRLLDAMLAFRVKPSRDRRVTKFARRATEDARRDVDRRRSAGPETPEELHRLRIAYKRLRYTAETFATVLPSDLASLAQPAARHQGRLGRLHDIDMALACVRAARSLSDPGRAALLGALESSRRERAAVIESDLGTTAPAPPAVAG